MLACWTMPRARLCSKRYYHLFEEGELEGLVQQVAGTELLQSFYDKGNWCVVFGSSLKP